MKNALFNIMLGKIEGIVKGDGSKDQKLQDICTLLSERVSHYDWVGFYLVNPGRERELVLGPYVGDPTDHVNIQFGEGICGQSAETKKIFVVQDVAQVTNYLACSPKVQSEIVVPIMRGQEFLGELDIDSHLLAPFTKHDEQFLESICTLVVELL